MKDREVARKVEIGMTVKEVIDEFGAPSDVVILEPDGSTVLLDYTGQMLTDCKLMFPYPNQPNKGFTVEFLAAKVVGWEDFRIEKERRKTKAASKSLDRDRLPRKS